VRFFLGPWVISANMTSLMASFSMGFAMANLSWKYYLINASYNIIILAAVYFLFVETKNVPLEEVTFLFEGPSVRGISSSLDLPSSDGEKIMAVNTKSDLCVRNIAW